MERLRTTSRRNRLRYTARANALKVEPHSKLNDSRQVELRTDNSEGRIRLVCGVVAAQGAGLAELNPVPHVEGFGTKLQIDLLGDCRVFEHCGVPVGDSLGAQ